MKIGDWVRVRATGEGGEIHAISGPRCTLRQINPDEATYHDAEVALADVDRFRSASAVRFGSPIKERASTSSPPRSMRTTCGWTSKA